MSTGDFIKGFHKISDLLTETQKTDIENYAYQYAKFHRVYFKVLKVDDENKKIIVQAKQNKHSFTNPYFTEQELMEKTKKLFLGFFNGYTINTHPVIYVESKSEIITPEYLKKELQKKKLRIKDIQIDTGLETSNLSAWINGIRPMSNIVKNMFYYYLLNKGK